MLITLDSIKASKDIKTKRVEVPEWGGHVFVKVFSGKERDEFDQFMVKKSRNGVVSDVAGFRVLMCILACCDENGKNLFDKKDADILAEKSSEVLQRIFDEAATINGMKADVVGDLKENFSSPPSVASGLE